MAIAEDRDVFINRLLQRLYLFDEREQSVSKLCQIPLPDARLVAEAISTAVGVGGVGCPPWVEVFEPAVGAVVDRQTEDREVVGVHHAMDEPDTLPMHDHFRGRAHDLAEELHVGVGRGFAVLGPQVAEVLADGEVREGAKLVELAERSGQLEVSESDEARRHPTNNGAGFERGVAVVEHVAHHLVAGEPERQGSRCGYAEVEHGLGGHELSDRRPQNSEPVRGS